MEQNSYYVSTAANPIELAELNVPFYTAFIQEMGYSRLYCHLWVGENLEVFIQNLRHYKTESKEMKARKANVVSLYVKFYRQLTGYHLK